MNDLSLFVFLVSIICLIVGRFKPEMFRKIFKDKSTRKTTSLAFGSLAISSFIIFGITTPSEGTPTLMNLDKDVENKEILQPKKLTTEDDIKRLVSINLKGKNNIDKPYLKDINVKMINEEAMVSVCYNESENITNNLTKVSIQSKMSYVYYALYESRLPITYVSISAYLPLTDKYGNQRDVNVYTTSLDKSESSKINWQSGEEELKSLIIREVWTTDFVHPALLAE